MNEQNAAAWPSLGEMREAEADARYHHYSGLREQGPSPGVDTSRSFREVTWEHPRNEPKVCEGCHTSVSVGEPLGIVTSNAPGRASIPAECYCSRCVRVLAALPLRPLGLPAEPEDDAPARRSWGWRK